jgi:hypothetical protein
MTEASTKFQVSLYLGLFRRTIRELGHDCQEYSEVHLLPYNGAWNPELGEVCQQNGSPSTLRRLPSQLEFHLLARQRDSCLVR